MIFMIFIIIFNLVLWGLVLLGVLVLLVKLLRALQRRGVGQWLFAPFRAWTGLDETRGPRL